MKFVTEIVKEIVIEIVIEVVTHIVIYFVVPIYIICFSDVGEFAETFINVCLQTWFWMSEDIHTVLAYFDELNQVSNASLLPHGSCAEGLRALRTGALSFLSGCGGAAGLPTQYSRRKPNVFIGSVRNSVV